MVAYGADQATRPPLTITIGGWPTFTFSVQVGLRGRSSQFLLALRGKLRVYPRIPRSNSKMIPVPYFHDKAVETLAGESGGPLLRKERARMGHQPRRRLRLRGEL